jgi:4-hydroxy-tetrahydrodipicolinate reductase
LFDNEVLNIHQLFNMQALRTLKIAIIGYGKMGREVEKVALERGHEVILILDNENDWMKKGHLLKKCDVAVEFTTPYTVIGNLKKCLEKGIPVVTGTTGWHDNLDEVRSLFQQKNGTLFTSSNFSVGVNIFFEINRRLAQLMNKYEMYDVALEEIHHTQKLDAPSGTAINLADDILARLDRKKSWGNQPEHDPEKLFIRSVREGNVPGIHNVTWESETDKIELRHEAKNRKGLAAGAIMAAEFISDKKGLYGMQDLLSL